jgi:uncharacterized protein DUF1592/uncharacterized protein DUF1588/uncharacterized protein DUF1585/uncharacterized protein DUF1595/uncharacterized protein DUF1587
VKRVQINTGEVRAMFHWRSGILFAAALAAACTTGATDDPLRPGARPGSENPGTQGSSAGNSGTPGTPGATVGTSPDCTQSVAPTSQIPRLNNAQYDRTVRDLLGITSLTGAAAPSSILATDQAGSLTSLGWSSYQSVAEKIAAQVMADPTLKAKFLKCTPSGDGKACLHDTIVQFGRRAFRRPLSADEVAGFDAIVAKGAQITATGAPLEVAEALLYMFLISPSFLQRSEITANSDGAGHFALSSHEVASRLSYLLWGSTPDDALSQAADADALKTPEQIMSQAQRMLQLPQAHDMVSEFHRAYLLMGTNTRWDTADRDPALFPAFKKSLVPALQQETEKFFDYVVFTQNGSFKDFLTSSVGFVNAATAPLYGLDASKFGPELVQTDLDPAQRPGFLTRVGFLNAFSGYNRTSPILRGAFITKQVLAVPIGSPPPGAETTPLPATADLDTNRKQVDQQTAGGTCSSCHHGFINPAGFALEAFDAAGALQTKEKTTGAPIDTAVEAVIDGVKVNVTGPADLMAKIAASPGAQRSYTEKWVSYAYERASNPTDACTVNQLSAKLTKGGYTVLNLVADLTQTQSFRFRAVEGAL